MDNVLIPWENVLIYRDFDRCRRWTMEGGFARMYPLQACVRLAVKLDFITALLKNRWSVPAPEFRGVQADPAKWSLAQYVLGAERLHVFRSHAVVNGAYLPDHAALQTYRVMAPMAYAKIKTSSNATSPAG